MENNALTPAQKPEYDPIQMLRDFLNNNPDTPHPLKNFLINRLGDQLVWYDKKSAFFKRKWERNRKIIIILSAAIPFLVGLIGEEELIPNVNTNLILKLIVGAAGVFIAVMEGFNSLLKSQELSVNYRLTAEKLKQEFSLFLGQTGDYADSGDKAFKKLVANVEAIISAENNQWAELARQHEQNAMAADVEKMVTEYLEKHGYAQPKKAPEPPKKDKPAG